jgi:hypothetical protein
MERSEGDMSLKNPVTPPGIDPGTIRLVAQRLVLGEKTSTKGNTEAWLVPSNEIGQELNTED